jgi:hypothetical protein
MKKCQTNTLRAFIKFLTSDEAQMQIRQCKLKPLLSEAQCQPKKPLVSTVPLSLNKPQIRKASGDSPFYVQQTKNIDASSSSFIICGLVAKDKNAVHLLGNISQFCFKAFVRHVCYIQYANVSSRYNVPAYVLDALRVILSKISILKCSGSVA